MHFGQNLMLSFFSAEGGGWLVLSSYIALYVLERLYG
jgi:hypothetical protein